MEHEKCQGCKWNKYPLCIGTKMISGNFMNIENLQEKFTCGQKDKLELIDFSIPIKSDLELKIEDLELQLKNHLEKN